MKKTRLKKIHQCLTILSLVNFVAFSILWSLEKTNLWDIGKHYLSIWPDVYISYARGNINLFNDSERFPYILLDSFVPGSITEFDAVVFFYQRIHHSNWNYTHWLFIIPLWAMMTANLIFPIGSLWRWYRKHHKSGTCPQCGYNLRTTPHHCPECGWNTNI